MLRQAANGTPPLPRRQTERRAGGGKTAGSARTLQPAGSWLAFRAIEQQHATGYNAITWTKPGFDDRITFDFTATLHFTPVEPSCRFFDQDIRAFALRENRVGRHCHNLLLDGISD